MITVLLLRNFVQLDSRPPIQHLHRADGLHASAHDGADESAQCKPHLYSVNLPHECAQPEPDSHPNDRPYESAQSEPYERSHDRPNGRA